MKSTIKAIPYVIVFSMILMALTACSPASKKTETSTEAPAPKGEYHKMSADEANKIINGNDPFILLDVRTQEEYEEKHIDGAKLIPDYEIAEKALTELTDKEATILIYCRSGNRSATATKKLAEMGYTKVYDFGGIKDWPYKTVSGK